MYQDVKAHSNLFVIRIGIPVISGILYEKKLLYRFDSMKVLRMYIWIISFVNNIYNQDSDYFLVNGDTKKALGDHTQRFFGYKITENSYL